MFSDEMISVNCSIVRGGTSKGIFLREEDLPPAGPARDALILAIFGSPDIRQIDGLGGADVLTSKLAIIGKPTIENADVDYTFGQVSFEKAFIDYKGNCGNISSAVGGYAIDMGIVKAVEPVTEVRIHLTNSHQILKAFVPVENGCAKVSGDLEIDGVPGTGARIDMDWSDIIGTVGGKLLPTGNAKDQLCIDGKNYTISIVDAGNPLVFIPAEDLDMIGTEKPAEIEADKQLMEIIEAIRGEAARILGLSATAEAAKEQSPYNPFFAIISKPSEHECFNGKHVAADEVDVVSRLLFMLHMHKAYPITGTVCTGAAARIPGSVVWDALNEEARNRTALRIGHPSGVIEMEADADVSGDEIKMHSIKVCRTARRILDGKVYVVKSKL